MFRLYSKTEYGEDCYNILLDKRFDKSKLPVLKSILGKENKGILITKSMFNENNVIEYGYKVNFESPWSTHIRTILNNCNIKDVTRIEKTYRVKKQYWDYKKNDFDSILHQIYNSPLLTFTPHTYGMMTSKVKIKDINNVNLELGLSLDEKDIEYYTDLFENKYKREPTNVELFDLSQSNSEHSRHWFFNGKLFIKNKLQDESLFKMVKNTLSCRKKTNSVLAFCDNSSAIRGSTINTIQPIYSKNRNIKLKEHIFGEYIFKDVDYDIVFTAETHNFPTGIAPFPGAATGTGGRIRDNQSIGKGGLLIAGTAGYCVGNLYIDGYELPWETVEREKNKTDIYDKLPATPLKIEIEASNGASDYGNKIGEPIINGFTRSFGMRFDKKNGNERIEWLKPIMFTGGLGQMSHNHLYKSKPEIGMLICRLGGPAYRIGFGGGSASSRGQDNKNSKFDLCAVQRGDPEMENKLNKVIRSCIELEENNPIESIHDQGAGGLGNVCKEIIEPLGGEIFLDRVTLGDKTLSDIEIWTCEYQEVDVCLVKPINIDVLKNICERENLILDIIGNVTDSERVVVYGKDGTTKIVDLELSNILGNIPRKEYKLEEKSRRLSDVVYPKIPLLEMCNRVFRLLSVGSKRFLTNKVDRSVTGLIAQQQCVGPLHTPLSNYAIVAQSQLSTKGIVTAIGEQPIKGLVSSRSMADMTIIELITNIMWVKVTGLEDIKCSGNWMWDIKKKGEQHSLYKTCLRMCDVIKEFGFSLDGGKDSLSMSTKVGNETISSPNELVLSGYVGCDDIRNKVTPDLKWPDSALLFIDLAGGHTRLGGSAFAQVFNQVGSKAPELVSSKTIINCFHVIQDLIDNNYIYSGHDRSDGGLLTTVVEMAISGNIGFDIVLPNLVNAIPYLWNEEAGIVIEVHKDSVQYVRSCLNINDIPFILLGYTNNTKAVTVRYKDKYLLDVELSKCREIWEATSFQIEKLQCNPLCVKNEEYSLKELGRIKELYYDCKLNANVTQLLQSQDPYNIIRGSRLNHMVAIIREEGSNGDREMAIAFKIARFRPVDVTMSDLMDEKFSLDKFRGIVFVGGFSYADTLGAGNGWASVIENTVAKDKLKTFFNRKDTFSLGVCNGCQLLVKMGIFGKNVTIEKNTSERFESRFSYVQVNDKSSDYRVENIFFSGMGLSKLGVWVAHGEGRFNFGKSETNDFYIPLQYINANGDKTMQYPYNPNGSEYSTAAISSPDGRHLAMMPHPERTILSWQAPWIPTHWKNYKYYPWIYMFMTAYKWCSQNKNK